MGEENPIDGKDMLVYFNENGEEVTLPIVEYSRSGGEPIYDTPDEETTNGNFLTPAKNKLSFTTEITPEAVQVLMNAIPECYVRAQYKLKYLQDKKEWLMKRLPIMTRAERRRQLRRFKKDWERFFEFCKENEIALGIREKEPDVFGQSAKTPPDVNR